MDAAGPGSEPSDPSERPGAATPASRSSQQSAGWVAVMGLVGAAAALVASRPLRDNSFLTHLATGRLILDGGVPSENPFLFTGTSFPVPSWWWSILLGLADAVGGGAAIRLLTALVAFAVGAALVRLARPVDRTESSGLLAAVLPTVLALYCMFEFLNGRPHVAGYLLLALTLVVWREERSPWWLVLLFAIWVNVHGSWLYGVVVLVAFGVARAVDDRRLRRRDLWAVGAALSGLVLGGALYPRAFEILLLPTRQFGDPIERQALQVYGEWSHVGLDQPMLWALIALGAVALVGSVRSRRWATSVAIAGVVVMGWSGARLVPIAAVSLVPFAAASLRTVGTLGLPTGTAVRRCWAVAAAVVVATVGYCLLTPSYVLQPYPVDAVDWLDERGLVGGDARLLSHDYVGNYLEWRYGADANAYVDDRADAATFVQYQRLLRADGDWTGDVDRIDPDAILWATDEPLTAELEQSDDWMQAGRFGRFSVFCRSELADRCS